METPNAHHEKWLNDTLPWVWITPLNHFEGAFPTGYLWTGLGLEGPFQTNMYVQKLPKPNELMEAPSGDFHRIDQCVAEKMAQDLNGEEYEGNGKSPHCPTDQHKEGTWGTWRYNCSGLRGNQTVKGILQA